MKTTKDYINLMPRQARRTAAISFDMRWTLVVLFFLAWVVLFGAKYLEAQAQQVRLNALLSQKQTLQQQLAAVQHELGLTIPAGMSPKKASLIQHLLSERVLWSEVFKQFSKTVPRGMWFDSLEGSTIGRSEIKIRGGALNYATISEFMRGLEKSSYFEKPRLMFAQRSVVREHDVVGFEISCGIKKAEGVKP